MNAPQPDDPPERMDPHLLRGFERLSVPALESINQSPVVKVVLHRVIGRLNAAIITKTIGRMWHAEGLGHLESLTAPRGTILASNHRSFFDMFVASTLLVRYAPHLIKQVTYPVRSNFFYTHPLGLVVNVAVSGASMWPPVFRDDRRRKLNPTGLHQMAHMLQQGSVLGIHPEGTRNKGNDPYTLLPAKPGLGQLVAACDPTTVVVPYFIAGLGNGAAREVRRSFLPPEKRGETVRVRFGAPFRVGELREGREPLEISEAVMARIRELGEADRVAQGRG